MKCFALVLLFLSIPFFSFAQTVPGYYRYPNIHGDTIVFTAEGDLWKVGLSGGVAQRLTTHPGVESFAAISPDGNWIAFSAQYEGPREIYTISIKGGLPVRRTYEGEDAFVVGWTPGGKILYSTNHYSTLPNTQLATIDVTSGTQALIPLSQASDGTFDPSGKTLYFTRLPFQGSHTKRYQGGTAQNLWKYSDGAAEATPLTSDYPGTSKTPMWWNERIYFVSDRDGTMNLWSMDLSGKDLQQHTHHKGWDVKSPSLDQGKIVYQLGADIHIYDAAKNEDRLIPITLSSDFDQTRERWIKNPTEYVTSVHLSPKGDRLAITARGRVFVAPVQSGRLVEVTRKNGVRYRDARFLSNAESLIMLSDETGEMEFWKTPSNGIGESHQLTSDGKLFRYDGIPSPDGKWIAYQDKDQKLWLFSVENKKTQAIDSSNQDFFYDLAWSLDSQWFAYVSLAENYYRQIILYHVPDGAKLAATTDRADSYSPTWSADGKWLYMLSDRFFKSEVQSPWGPRQPEPFYDKVTKIYSISLLKTGRSPFESADELHPQETESKPAEEDHPGKKEPEKSKKTESKKPEQITIDRDGIQERLYEVPVTPGNYERLSMTEKHLYWVEGETSVEPKKKLMALEIKNTDIKPKLILEEIKDYELASGREKILITKKDGSLFVIDANGAPSEDLEMAKVDLKNWSFTIQPREEWRQMFVEAWRLERDFFYDPHMHGLNYKGLLEKHLPLVDRVSDRDELADLISDLVGELSALHIFVFGGDKRKGTDEISVGSLGALLTKEESSKGYRISHIYHSDPNYPENLSPLAKSTITIAEGDIIETINGTPLLSVPDPVVLLKNQAGQQVLLHIRSAKSGKAFDTVVKPIEPNAEQNLRYDDWEFTERNLIDKLSNGKIGYVHLRAMGGDNYSEWVRNFYPVFNRDGLVVDVRNNQGGNIDSWILEKLLRKAWFYWQPRVGKPYWNMQYAFRGHVVVICNEWTSSDGEAFCEGFRRLGIGKIIGTRTWGGEIWLSFDNELVDKGMASAAEYGVYSPDHQWMIEGHGVDPDIAVDNLPHATFLGQDSQLETAVKYLQEEIKKSPVVIPPPPPYPVKSKPEEEKPR
jgi:tricorn protease